MNELICFECKKPFELDAKKKEDILYGKRSPLCDKCLDIKIINATKSAEEKSNAEKLAEEEEDLREECWQLLLLKKRTQVTELLTNHIEKYNHIYTTRNDLQPEIWIYSQGIYTPHGRTYIKEFIRHILKEGFTNTLCNEVISKIEADTYIDSNKFFNINYVEEIPVENGILNIRSRIISEFNPEKIFFNKLPVKYDETATCADIDRFLSNVLAREEDKIVFYEIGGYSLFKNNNLEKAFIFVGSGRNGKSKTIKLIEKVIGSENTISLPLSALSYDNADVSQIFGKMINTAGDIGNQDLKDSSLFKQITGRDLITTKRKFLQAITFLPYTKFIFGCNELPKVYDMSKGFWERWVLLDFPFYFADKEEFEQLPEELRDKHWKLKDKDILEKISSEEQLSGLLNAFLDGLDRLLKNNNFSTTKGSDEIKNYWIRKSDSFQAFCMDCICEDAVGFIPKKEIRKKFSSYCKKHKLKGASDKAIKVTLEDLYGVSDNYQTLTSGITNTQEWVWEGIKWKN